MTGDAPIFVVDPLFWVVLGTEIAVVWFLVWWRNR